MVRTLPDDYEGDKEAESLIKIVNDIKALGNGYFSKGEYKQAYAKYSKAINYLNERPVFMDEDTEELKQQWIAAKLPCYLNRAAAALKLEDYRRAATDSTVVIETEGASDKDRTKAYFRRGTAQNHLKAYEEAIADLSEARRLSATEDAGILRELQLAQKRLAARKEKERQAYSKMFG
ncbi:hypothetical protein SYNPS1DRAFT_31556 [Syncephalis pseudoplumigaleata]|uniref:peptidylprolyl isomerase n=1 Tax=Syncephalis pseudoplumigaleata TaxID=1712513 RepID=A0A4P9YS94_9FUNG|nr:hypothetical protein SYNPS1DRAFT_31556 [Syncephalis pseudoplumigaleata]|eukprot:RKP22793.1 hypothetical protein SYNPS1DRAFT_31556 [Syncephalis pseudoplumigaleata]